MDKAVQKDRVRASPPSRRVVLSGSLAVTGVTALAVSPAANAAEIRPGAPGTGWPGHLLRPQAPDAQLRAVLREISAARVEADRPSPGRVRTRHTLSTQTDPRPASAPRGTGSSPSSQGYAATLGWADDGRDPVVYPAPGLAHSHGHEVTNVAATLRGSTDPGRMYVISGHYDSRVTDIMGPAAYAPGADDDASGVAVSMELARVMATRGPDATIVLHRGRR